MSIFDSHPEDIDRFEALLKTEDDRSERLRAIESAIRIAERLVEEHPDDADAFQFLGLAWYHFPAESSWRSWHCRRALQRAIQIDQNHQFARHYLACLDFDQELYADALRVLSSCDFDFFVVRDQEWRALKNEELKIVCRLRILPETFPQGEFDAFLQRFCDAQKREEEDFTTGSWVWPQELREHLEWMVATGVNLNDSVVRELLKFFTEIGYTDSFWDPRIVKQIAENQAMNGSGR